MTIKNKGGRPSHQPTEKDRGMVEALAGFGIPEEKIAAVLAITIPTLRKHYLPQIERGAAMVEAKLVGNLLRLASGADGTALKAITFALQCRFGWSQYAPPPVVKQPELGKKEIAQIEAERGHESSDWGRLLN